MHMDSWISRLREQLSAAMPKEPKTVIPPLSELYHWVDSLILGAEICCSNDLQSMKTLSWQSAWQNEVALIAALVVGRYLPPIRLEILRTLVHPDHVTPGVLNQCINKDCRDRKCPGNHISVYKPAVAGEQDGGFTGRRIHFKAPHHKNDRRGFSAIEFDLPEGKLTERLLDHIDYGHQMLTQLASGSVLTKGDLPSPILFVSRAGNPFSTCTFSQFWTSIIREVEEIPHFPPSLARTAFVDSYTAQYGEEPLCWEGAATIMGNTTGTWGLHYNPLQRGRQAQAAVDRHTQFAASLGC